MSNRKRSKQSPCLETQPVLVWRNLIFMPCQENSVKPTSSAISKATFEHCKSTVLSRTYIDPYITPHEERGALGWKDVLAGIRWIAFITVYIFKYFSNNSNVHGTNAYVCFLGETREREPRIVPKKSLCDKPRRPYCTWRVSNTTLTENKRKENGIYDFNIFAE